MICISCSHRLWEDGDRDHSPPGYGTFYCELTNQAMSKAESEHAVLITCPLPKQLPLFILPPTKTIRIPYSKEQAEAYLDFEQFGDPYEQVVGEREHIDRTLKVKGITSKIVRLEMDDRNTQHIVTCEL